jgi:hypothetical protein
MLASKIKRRVSVPHEPGEWFDIRALGGRALDEARRVRMLANFATLQAMGHDILTSMQTAAVDDTVARADPDPLAAYDVDTVLRSGITAWSYDAKVNPANIGELDEQTREWAAREIVALCGETEAERKND